MAVTTVEGIGSTKARLHPVQQRIAESHGSQCGFCTPGIVMSMYALLRTSRKPTMHDLEVAFQGNLCRCTGYRAIIDGFRSFVEGYEFQQRAAPRTSNGACAMGDKCCKAGGAGGCSGPAEALFEPSEFAPYDPTQEPIFPPELLCSDAMDAKRALVFRGKRTTWYRPATMDELLKLKSDHPAAKLVVGNTEVGVEVKFKHCDYPVLVQPTIVPELNEIRVVPGKGVRVGAAVTLRRMEEFLRDMIDRGPAETVGVFSAVVDMLNWFAGRQIRNVACLGGNIMTGSPISDLNPIFMAADVDLEFRSVRNSSGRVVKMNEHFFTGYRRNAAEPDEVLVAVMLPFTESSRHFVAYKQARRREDDIAIVNCALNVLLEPGSHVIKDLKVAFGGMAPTTVLAPNTSAAMRGKVWTASDTVERLHALLLDELPLAPSAPGGMINYRRALTLSFAFKAHLTIAAKVGKPLDARDRSAVDEYVHREPVSSQYFETYDRHSHADRLHQPVRHVSAAKQATGEAVYVDDIPTFENEAYLGIVFSTRAHARLRSIDASAALAMDGVYGFVSAKDIPHNHHGPIFHDEEVYVSETVTSQGQAVAGVLARDQMTAQRAARAVKVDYENLSPTIVSIEDAIAHESYHVPPRSIARGDPDAVFASVSSERVVQGECRTGYQEHFYFETQACVVRPRGEDDELEVFTSGQHPSETTREIASVFRIQQSKVVTRVKRMGGGFGGKESMATKLALAAAGAARKYNRPVRIMLDRDEDMVMSGGRHPFLLRYKVAYDDTGKLLALDINIYSNAGYSSDLSTAVLERAMLHCENAYYIPNVRATGYCCKTNLPSNTAFRGFGGPQGMFAAETYIRHVADMLRMDPVTVAERNLYKPGDITPYNQTIEDCELHRCWDECLHLAHFEKRREQIVEFNKANRWKKRGIAVVPTKFGIAFTVLFLNQAGAYVIVYTDGSVLVTHGGTEMGQGLHTKMIQIVSREFGIPMERVHISETATDKVPNTSPTAASASSDLNGMAVLNACRTIKKNLEPFIEADPNAGWDAWVRRAYENRVCLYSSGFYATPDIGYDINTNTGKAFNYFTLGVACTEVEVDCLTGDHTVLRSDIVMDLGQSLNPAIDIGQVEGGFLQGYGLFTMEEMMCSPKGVVYTRGPGAYKIPGFGDVPVEFNVSLLKSARNPRAVFSSKAVGEPPLFLASSALFAIRDACREARREHGVTSYFALNAPATAAAIRMACVDTITEQVGELPPNGTYTPWNVLL